MYLYGPFFGNPLPQTILPSIWDTVQKYMVCNNAENKRLVKVAIPTLQRQNKTLLQRQKTTLDYDV